MQDGRVDRRQPGQIFDELAVLSRDEEIDELTRELPKEDPTAYDRLTGREREVLQLLAEGNATKEIANKLHVSVSTVETHRRQVMEKLELFSVAELTKYAIREGLTSVDI